MPHSLIDNSRVLHYLNNSGECKCNHLFTSNRQGDCKTVKEFYEKRFDRKTSPFSPKFQYIENKFPDLD